MAWMLAEMTVNRTFRSPKQRVSWHRKKEKFEKGF
jgi:hypothetical protein